MFTKYVYLPRAIPSEVLSDLNLLITGETNKNNLSKSCDYDKTSIISSVGAGWTYLNESNNFFMINVGSVSWSFFGANVTFENCYFSTRTKHWYNMFFFSNGHYVYNGYTTNSISTNVVSWSATSANPPSVCDTNTHTIVMPQNISSAGNLVLYSPDGINWSSTSFTGTLTAINACASNGTAVVGVSSTSQSKVIYSPDGVSPYTTKTCPAGVFFDVTSNGSIFVAVGTSACMTSPDGITWTSRTIPAGTWYSVAWNGSTFCAIGTNICATSPDGITWTSRTLSNATGQKIRVGAGNRFIVFTSTTVWSYSSDGITWTTFTVPTTTIGTSVQGLRRCWDIDLYGNLVAFDLNITNTTFTTIFSETKKYYYRADNLDGSFKYTSMYKNRGLQLLPSQLITGTTETNPCYPTSTVSSNSDQQLDFYNGGTIYIAATKYYLAILTSIGTLVSQYGDFSTNSYIGVFEYTREDAWNVAANYTCWANFHPSISSNFHVPIMKSNTTPASDLTGVNAFLPVKPNIFTSSGTKVAIDNEGVQYYPIIDIKITNSNGTYLILGGKILGGVKQTVNSFGINGDDLTINNITYSIFKHGSYTHLFPKA